MGARAQIKIIENEGDPAVFLYTHWGARTILATLQRALARRQRWDDPEYLARIIFSEMIRDDINGETGFGIGTTEHGDLYFPPVEVDVNNKTVRVQPGRGAPIFQWTFEDLLRIQGPIDPKQIEQSGKQIKA